MQGTEYTTERDVTLDVAAALEMYEGLCGSETTTIEEIDPDGYNRQTITLTLSNGDRYELLVRSL